MGIVLWFTLQEQWCGVHDTQQQEIDALKAQIAILMKQDQAVEDNLRQTGVGSSIGARGSSLDSLVVIGSGGVLEIETEILCN